MTNNCISATGKPCFVEFTDHTITINERVRAGGKREEEGESERGARREEKERREEKDFEMLFIILMHIMAFYLVRIVLYLV